MSGATDHPARHVLLIGGQRCGTTYLGAALDAHPQITLARPSRPEPKVWNDAALAARGHASYDALFFAHAADERLLVDKSTSYLEDPEAPGRAAEALGDPLVVVLLRNPVQRAISNWRFSTDHGLETRDLEEALLADLDGEQPWAPGTTSVSPFAYVRRGRYVDHLAPWAATFPRSTHVVFLEELLADPGVLTDLVAALGAAPGLTPGPVGHPVNQSSTASPALSPSLRGTLQEYYEPANAALADLLGRKVPW